jgi:copper homeostasis protein
VASASIAALEIAANSLASALAAQDGGADRIELCSALEIGGLTPSYAQIAVARDRIRIPIYVLIRPRAGDFIYNDLEFETIQRDIEACVSLGCDGVVIGALDFDDNVDVGHCRQLIAAAGNVGVTFHRAFDLCRDPHQALDDIVALGCERVLTSGGKPTAREGAPLIRTLVAQAGGRISVMPGAGIDATTIAAVRELTGAHEFHASAKRQMASRLRQAGKPELSMIAGELRTDIEQVRAMAAMLRPPRPA